MYLDGVSGHEVAEADGGERDEAEVGGRQQVPPLPHGEEETAAADVPAAQQQQH